MISKIFFVLAAFCFTISYAEIVPISETEKQESVNSHNEWRKNARATAMRHLKWNDELAKFAEAAAARCSFDHTPHDTRKNVGGFAYIGENIYVNTAKTSFKDAIDSWGSEEKDYDLDTNTCRNMCGHYTQITWSKTSEVGCAVSKCGNVEGFGYGGYLIFCNYGHGGNMQGEKPFERGTPGSKCQEHFNIGANSIGLCGEEGSANTGSSNDNDINENDNAGNTDTDNNNENENDGIDEFGAFGNEDNTDGDNDVNTGGDNGDNTGDNGDNTGDNTGVNPDNENGQGNTGGGNQGECQDEIWYCHDWLQSCDERWARKACRKSCNLCNNDPNEEYIENTNDNECKDKIWYCHDYPQSCGEPWASRACRKSCKFC